MSTKGPEEIAEGLSDAQKSAMRRPGYWLGSHSYGRTLRVLQRKGLIRALSWSYVNREWTAIVEPLGRAVADVLAKRGAR